MPTSGATCHSHPCASARTELEKGNQNEPGTKKLSCKKKAPTAARLQAGEEKRPGGKTEVSKITRAAGGGLTAEYCRILEQKGTEQETGLQPVRE